MGALVKRITTIFTDRSGKSECSVRDEDVPIGSSAFFFVTLEPKVE